MYIKNRSVKKKQNKKLNKIKLIQIKMKILYFIIYIKQT